MVSASSQSSFHHTKKAQQGALFHARAYYDFSIAFPILPTTSLKIAPEVPMFTRAKHAPWRPKSSPRMSATFPFLRKTFAALRWLVQVF